jgi:hypothetical protein
MSPESGCRSARWSRTRTIGTAVASLLGGDAVRAHEVLRRVGQRRACTRACRAAPRGAVRPARATAR